MKNKNTFLLHNYIFVFALLLLTPISMFSQTITSVSNGSPSFGGNVTQRCYNPSSGAFLYYSTFAISGTFNPGNVFTLELSDAAGSFAAPAPTFLSNTPTFSGSTGTFAFQLPAGTAGNAYRLRVVSSSPAITSTLSQPVPSYYIPFTGTFYLLNNRVQNVSICGGASFNLFVDTNNVSLPSATTVIPSPRTYPGLIYKWVKDGSPFPGTGPSIDIDQSGVYYAYIDYGVCNNGTPKPTTSTLDVTVNIVPSGSTVTITGNPIVCPPSTTTLTVLPAGYPCKWFKDGEEIIGATTTNTYDAPQPGIYSVNVQQGTCFSKSNDFKVYAVGFSASIDVSLLPDVNIIGTGETKSITITSNAATPKYKWYLNGVLISSATSSTYIATQAGKYKAVVNQTAGCLVEQDFLFELKEGVNPKEIPNLISPNGDTKNDTWILPSEYGNVNTDVQIISSNGEVVLQTTNYQNNWPLNEIDFKTVNPVYYYIITKDGSQVKKGSITIIK